ncbi:MAG TPA: DUF5916 domain-containing protein [Longimicrobiales bacterium]|nr:DUF5916 domain-containing protein [Longimicrobiales bacterium]
MARSLFVIAMLAAATPLAAQSHTHQAHAIRLNGEKPNVDGQLSENVWQTAQPISSFTQFKPNPGDPSKQKTELRFAYDDDALYIAARMFDSHPDSIVAQLARRDDDIFSDWILVAIDSYYDRRTAFAFGVNARGVKRDMLLYDDTNDDDSWDAVWDGASRIDSLGWTAEFRIPLSQLRFSAPKAGQEMIWGAQALRVIARYNEESFWAPTKPDGNALVSAFGDLVGVSGLKPPRRAEVLPYSMSRLVRAPGERANPFYHSNESSLGAGADLKLGVTSDLTLTATINPDFGQVEADPSVVNLTAYETFFPEKRPFFIEGFDIFRAGIGVGDGDGGNEALFYSRRIGRAPQGDAPDVADYSDMPSSATILGAAKLSGKTKSGWSVGLLSAATAEEKAKFFGGGADGVATVEPFTHYGVARVIKDFDKGQSALGAVVTTVNRDLPENLTFLRSSAYAGGVNGRKRWKNGDYQLSGFVYTSRVAGDTAAINRTQRSSARYYQRPDNDYVDYDPTRTSLDGVGAGAEFFKMGGGHWRYAAAVNVRTPGFEVNDLGFMPGSDRALQVAFVGYNEFTPSKHFNRWNVNVNQWQSWTFGGERTGFGGNWNASAELKNTADVWAGMNREQEALSISALRGGPAFLRPGSTGWNVGYDSDERKAVNYWIDLSGGKEDDGNGKRLSVYPGVRIRASKQMELRLNPGVTWESTGWQYVSTETANNQPAYVFGSLDQITTSLTLRMSYTFTPDISLQLYAQPFISAGDFSDFRQVNNPRAANYVDRFKPYSGQVENPDFNYRAMRSNAVLRWEYRPGSSLFLVWSQGREASVDIGDYAFSRDSRGLLRAQPTNVLLIKASYWLGL